MIIRNELIKLSDKKYSMFNSKLIPNIDTESVLGIKMPVLRKFAKSLTLEEKKSFLNDLPHKYLEENNLHSVLLNDFSDYELLMLELEKFLPYINNWETCDVLKPKVFLKNLNKVHIRLKEWLRSENEYTVRFALVTLMNFYLTDYFKREYLEYPLIIKLDTYYVKMAVAWFYAEALVTQWDDAIKIIEGKKLNKWTHNKSIQKAVESFRIPLERKEYLKSLKIR